MGAYLKKISPDARHTFLSMLQVVSLLISLALQMLIAGRIGPSTELDSYYAVTGFATALVGCVASAAFYQIPGLVHIAQKAGDEEPVMAGNAAVSVVLLGIIVAVASISVFLVGGAAIHNSSEVKYDHLLTLLAWLAALASLLATVFGAIGNAYGKTISLICLGTLPLGAGIVYILAYSSPNAVGLASSQLVGFGLQASCLALIYRQYWSLKKLSRDRIFMTMRVLPIASAGVVCFTGYSAIDAFLAPILGPEVLSHQAFAQRLVIAFGAVLSVGPFMHSANMTSRMIAEHRYDDVQRYLLKSAGSFTLTCLLAAALTPSLGHWIIGLLFERGAFGPKDTSAVALNVTVLLLGAGPMLLTTVTFRALHNLSRAPQIARLGMIWVLLYGLSANLLSNLMPTLALSISYSFSWWLIGVATLIFARNAFAAVSLGQEWRSSK